MTTDLLDEITEDLKEERYHNIVRKLTKLFSIFAVLAVIAVSIYAWKEHVASKLRYDLSIWFNEATLAIEQNNLEQAIICLDKIIEHDHQQYAALAYLNKAAILFKQNENAQAEEILLIMAKQKHFNVALKELAQLTYLSSQLNNKAIPDNAKEILANLSKENKPWQFSSLQLKALYEIKQNKIAEAKTSLEEIIKNNQANQSNKDAAASILAVISRK